LPILRCGIASLALVASVLAVQAAPRVRVFGVNAGIASATPGAFLPANSDLVCYALNDEGQCWDGKIWHPLYPSGPRQFVKTEGETVACRVIDLDSADCWTGTSWYRLPKGQVMGVVSSPVSATRGAFLARSLPNP
jgi:hypothetical protein